MSDDTITRLNQALEGRYSVQRRLGEGGMAMVFLAEDLKHDRPVALKVLRPELAALIGAERFVAEIKTTANLQHPHILPLFDSGESDGFLYYVMPYVEGESLRDRIDREQQLPIADAVSLTRDIADALDYAHRQGVIHRDIKPANVLLHDGNPVVADFGIAVAVSAAGGARLTETGLSLGTPYYMSPEQATADRELTARSDIYSLACVLHEMLTGRPPHTGPSAQSVLVQVLTEEAQPVTELRKSTPPHVAAAVAKGLEKLPADRFESAAELSAALVDPAFSYATATHTRGRTDRTGSAPPWIADSRSRVTLLAFAVTLVLLGLRVLGDRGDRPEVPSIPRTVFEIDLGDLEVPSQMTLSPDGSRLVFVSRAPGEVPRLYMRRSGETEIMVIAETDNASDPAFSRDGEWIAFVVDDIELKRVAAVGGAPLSVTTHEPNISAPSWGPDGSILFAAQQGIFRVPSGGGSPEQVLASQLFSSRVPRFASGLETILFTHQFTTSTEPELRLLDVASGEVTPIAPGRDGRYLETGHLIYVTLGGTTVVAPFDPESGRITGEETVLVDDIAMGPIEGEGLHLSLSHSGTAVYAVGRSNPLGETLVTIELDGTEAPVRGLLTGNYSAPRFDPTGRYLAFEFDGAVWIRDLVLGRQQELYGPPSFNPIWSRDGSRIVFGHATGSGSQLRVRAADLTTPSDSLIGSPQFVAPSAWTIDDSRIVFGEFEGQNASGSEIWSTSSGPPDDRTPFLRADGWDEGFATLSPDGRWAAYESDEDGRKAVYAQPFPEPGLKVRISEGWGIGARWTQDGIFYRNGDSVKVARVRTDPTLEVIAHETLFVGPYTGIDPHPDGTRFVAIKRAQPGGADSGRRLLFVVNWLEGVLVGLQE